ncbi:MAG: hypothetical protein PWP10_4158 [Clostridiales bacterium]|nr:hypothetical protein [Clostridiales bacterium]
MNKSKTTFIVLLVLILMVVTIFPFAWMLSTSFKPATEIYQEPSLIPDKPTISGYESMLKSTSKNFDFKIWMRNSLIVSLSTTLFSLLIASMGGFGLSRFKFPGKKALGYFILMTQVLPGSLLIIPLYVVLNSLGLLNNLIGLVLAYTTFSVPFCTWTMKGFFDTIPKSLDESARVDGCGYFKAFYSIILPLTLPGLIATGLFSFIAGWNEYLFASIFMQRYDKWTLPVGISTAVGQYSTDWSSVMAGSVMITIPVVIMFLLLQKHLVSGMTAGAVKQ